MGLANVSREKANRTVDESPLAALKHRHINEKIYDLLLAGILSPEYAPGQRLRVEEIAAALHVSRTPVKDAINRLAVEGLVVVQPRKGTFVADITPEGIGDFFDVRLMIELHAAERAIVRATDRDLAELEELVTSLARFVDDDRYTDYEAFLELDNEFHVRVLRIAGNPLLLKLYRDINLHVQLVRAYHRAPGAAEEAVQTRDEHWAILSAFKARDAVAVRAALTTHILNRGNQFIQALSENKSSGQKGPAR